MRTLMKVRFNVVLCLVIAGCGSKTTPGGPAPTSPTPTNPPRLTAPTPDSPSNQGQLSTLRPTLTVANGTSDQAGTRTYEFQISDRADFSSLAPAPLSSVIRGGAFLVVATKTGVPEGDGKTTFTPDEDLQPTTRFYWRARVAQGTSTSDWSEVRSFKTKLMGFNRPGELYDPLIHAGETVGKLIGSTTFIDGKGIRVNNGNSYVRYELLQTITNGEFSADVTGLYGNGPGGKMRVLSMMNGEGNLCKSKFLFNVQYRGVPGNPDNAFSYKALFGDEAFKNEPDKGIRTASVRLLDPSRTYHWKATWSSGINLVVQEDRIGGNTIFNHGTSTGGIYNPSPHYAYLGANNGGKCEEEGSWPGLTYSNVWIGNRPRPESLGSALDGK